MDDQPVGGGSGPGPKEFADDGPAAKANPDADKPLDQRLISKTWSIRKEAFEELMGQMKKLSENSSKGLMAEHASNWAKYLAEPNPGALEKVLECF